MSDMAEGAGEPPVCLEAQLLRVSLRSAFIRMVTRVSPQRFQDLFQLEEGQALRLHNKFVTSFVKRVMLDLDTFMADENIEDALNIRSKLIKDNEAQADVEAWRPNGDVHQHLRSHDVQEKQKINQQLVTCVSQAEVELQMLQMEVLAKRSRARELHRRIGELTRKLQVAGGEFIHLNKELEAQYIRLLGGMHEHS